MHAANCIVAELAMLLLWISFSAIVHCKQGCMLQFIVTHNFLGPLITALQILEGVWQFVNRNIINFATQKWYNCEMTNI